jgi:DMSO/TMAO reductase YedYZ molybdopterin-dependent catalytic subunit
MTRPSDAQRQDPTMSRIIRRLAALSIAALLTLGLAAREPAAQQAGVPNGGDPPKRTARKESGALLVVRGEVGEPLVFSAEEFAKLPRQSVRAKAHDGVDSRYEGVPLAAILAKAGEPMGGALKGNALTLYLVVEASDGYRALFALPELDSAFTDRVILLADHRDGRPLSDREGPLQVIVPGEKKHARWVRQVIRIVVGRA